MVTVGNKINLSPPVSLNLSSSGENSCLKLNGRALRPQTHHIHTVLRIMSLHKYFFKGRRSLPCWRYKYLAKGALYPCWKSTVPCGKRLHLAECELTWRYTSFQRHTLPCWGTLYLSEAHFTLLRHTLPFWGTLYLAEAHFANHKCVKQS
jgi:hypothetical protein